MVVAPVHSVLRLEIKIWILLGLMVGHNYSCRVHPVQLMRQKISPFVISVVCNNKPFGSHSVFGFLQVVIHDNLNNLRSLASRRSTHVEDRVMGLDIAKDRRHHAYELLSREQSSILGAIYDFVNLLQALVLLQKLLGHEQLVDEILGIKGLAVDLELIEIDVDIPELFSLKVIFLLHANALVQFLLGLYFCSFIDLNFNSVVLYEFWIFQHIYYFLEI